MHSDWFSSRPHRRLRGACLGVLALALAAPALAADAPNQPRQRRGELQGMATRVVDGDSLWFTPAGRAPIEVRLARIDAPELCQAHGEQSKGALGALVLNKPARLQRVARDSYGRVVAHLSVDGVDIATRMVEEGQAWSARQRNDRGPLMKQERMARALGRGLHSVPGSMLPRDFRRTYGPCSTPTGASRR